MYAEEKKIAQKHQGVSCKCTNFARHQTVVSSAYNNKYHFVFQTMAGQRNFLDEVAGMGDQSSIAYDESDNPSNGWNPPYPDSTPTVCVDLATDLNPAPHPDTCECERCLHEALVEDVGSGYDERTRYTREERMKLPTTLKLCCPACGHSLRVPLYRFATYIGVRKCRCKRQWTIKAEVLMVKDEMLVHEISWSDTDVLVATLRGLYKGER